MTLFVTLACGCFAARAGRGAVRGTARGGSRQATRGEAGGRVGGRSRSEAKVRADLTRANAKRAFMPRMYKNDAEKQRAYRVRLKQAHLENPAKL